MQLATMPVTPLGRRMQYFESHDVITSTPTTEARSSGNPISMAVPRQSVPQSHPSEPYTPPLVENTPLPQASTSLPSQSSGIAKYESRDAHGRVWGVPNAGGRGQCLDCPNKALLPSTRCRECQLRLAQGSPMVDLAQFQARLDRAAQRCRHKEVAVRLETLYQKLQNGQVPDSMQEKLRRFAELLESDERNEGQKVLKDLISQHWEQHKYWLTGLKWLNA